MAVLLVASDVTGCGDDDGALEIQEDTAPRRTGEPGNAEDRSSGECTQASWWNANYPYRVHFEIDNAIAMETLDNFPVLVRLDPAWFDYDLAAPDGDDLRFRGPRGADMGLAYEIDLWVPGGESTVWVEYTRLPWDDAEATSEFWLYYGNPDAEPRSDGGNVFSRYMSVNHMNAVPKDSVGDHPVVPMEDRQRYGVPELCRGECEPLVGEAQTFDADEKDAAMLWNTQYVTFTRGERLSASLWVRTTNLDRVTGWTPIFSKAEASWRIVQYENTSSPTLDFDCTLEVVADHDHCGGGSDIHGNYHIPALGTNIDDGDWHHLAFSFSWPYGQRWLPYDRPLTGRIFVDGELRNEAEFVDAVGDIAAMYGGGAGYPITLATKADQPTGRSFDGAIDEVRISGDEFSPAWFAAEYGIVRNHAAKATEWETCIEAN